jgi:demethylmenaquinone methyltransferase/2-methoxy-6-polyprenyl-1,4-benzoquinol methylase
VSLKSTMPVAGSADRAPAVRQMFDDLAPRYDLANRVLSLGLDQWWRKQAIAALHDAKSGVMLDLCAGTLDLTRMLIDVGATHVHAADFSAAMLATGEAKLQEDEPYTIHCEDARSLPFEDASMDGIICGFGLRNVPDLPVALQECARVLRPGGRLVVLDFFQPVGFFPRVLQGSYNRIIVPLVGGMLTGAGEAYRYLNESIDAFQTPADFVDMLNAVGIESQAKIMFPPVAHMIHGVRKDD